MVLRRSTVATRRPLVAASSSLICRIWRALWISGVTFLAICTVPAPSDTSSTGQVVTLKI